MSGSTEPPDERARRPTQREVPPAAGADHADREPAAVDPSEAEHERLAEVERAIDDRTPLESRGAPLGPIALRWVRVGLLALLLLALVLAAAILAVRSSRPRPTHEVFFPRRLTLGVTPPPPDSDEPVRGAARSAFPIRRPTGQRELPPEERNHTAAVDASNARAAEPLGGAHGGAPRAEQRRSLDRVRPAGRAAALRLVGGERGELRVPDGPRERPFRDRRP